MKHFITGNEAQRGELPWCKVEWMSNRELVGAEQILLVRATFEPRQKHRFHTHPQREEVIYVLEGQAEQWVGTDKQVLRAGEMAHIPKNTPHATRNAGAGRLVFLAILSPVEAEGEFAVDLFDQEPWNSILPA
jgi:quercetin dioxygenase-like cupin family protein